MPTKEFILSLNNAKPPKDQFIIEDLDDTRLFVQAKVAEWLQEQIAAWQEQNTYQVRACDTCRLIWGISVLACNGAVLCCRSSAGSPRVLR